jgi:hypothetical protein
MEKSLPAGEFATRRVTAQQIRDGVLADFDVIILPGGTGSGEAKNLREAGRAKIKTFVEKGGGYVGFCAGAYLASSHYSWSLHLMNAKVVDTAHWARGNGDVELRLTDEGKKLMGRSDETLTCRYAQGPLLAPGKDAAAPTMQTLATYDSEIALKGAPKGVMKGTVAIACATYFKGRVWCFSPHPEKTEALRDLVRRAVDWCAGREIPGRP